MKARFQRRRFFIHPSSQFKSVLLTILPALIMSIFCTYFLIRSGELILQIEKERAFIEISAISQTIFNLESEQYPPRVINKVKILRSKLISLENILKMTYFNSLQQWRQTKLLIFTVLFGVLLLATILSILYSHRIAGPLFRMRKCIDLLAEGRDIPPVRLRRSDEFKELAASLDNLRKTLKDKGLLGSK